MTIHGVGIEATHQQVARPDGSAYVGTLDRRHLQVAAILHVLYGDLLRQHSPDQVDPHPRLQQRISELNLEASGVYAAAWGNPVGHDFAKGSMSGYLGARATTIYGGASEVQKDIVTKKVLGIKSAKK